MYAIRSYYAYAEADELEARRAMLIAAMDVLNERERQQAGRHLLTRGDHDVVFVVEQFARQVLACGALGIGVITSYSIHYTKLYDVEAEVIQNSRMVERGFHHRIRAWLAVFLQQVLFKAAAIDADADGAAIGAGRGDDFAHAGL